MFGADYSVAGGKAISAQTVDTMASNSNSSTQSQSSTGGPVKKSNNRLIYYAIAVIVVIAVVVLAFSFIGPSSTTLTTTINQTHSLNSTPLYMSATQAQALLGSSPSNYSTDDIFNPSASVNITDLASIVPALATNATSGWLTYASGSNSTANASIDFIVVTTNNTATIATALGTNVTASLNITATTLNSGASNELSYTYGLYKNSTSSYQVLYGYKGSDLVLVYIQENPGFAINETSIVSTVSSIV